MGRSTLVNSVQTNENIQDNPHQVSLPDFCVYNILNFADVCAFQNNGENEADEIQILPTVVISMPKGGNKIRALLDTGSTSSFIYENTLSLVDYEVVDAKVPLTIHTLHG